MKLDLIGMDKEPYNEALRKTQLYQMLNDDNKVSDLVIYKVGNQS